MPSRKVLLFDLGGVIVDYAGLRHLPELLGEEIPPAEMRQRWISSQAVIDFEVGAITPQAFAEQFLAEWPLPVDADAFLSLFQSWLTGPFEGAVELLEALRPRYTLACLSNTNELHWEQMLEGHGLRACFAHHYASHLLRRAKPDPEIYGMVARNLERDPAEIVFFDDGQDNIDGAHQAGLQAHRVEGVAELRRTLRELDYLEGA